MRRFVMDKRVQWLVITVASVLAVWSVTTPGAQSGPLPIEKLRLPPGFKIELYASVPNARSMTLSDSGVVYVGNRNFRGNVYAVTDADKDGKSDAVIKIADGMLSPNGVAYKDGALYVACVNTVFRFDNIDSRLKDPPKPVVVNNGFPSDMHHGWKYIKFGPDGLLYIPVGAPCNVCERDDPRYASLMRMQKDGKNVEIFARGIRNTVGFDWHPETGEVWFTDNGRDYLGDNLPPDELNRAPTRGLHFGFPYRYGSNQPDPEFGKKAPGDVNFVSPAQNLDAHVAALGMSFYRGSMFPKEYADKVFIAEHGSWNRSRKSGYRVMQVTVGKDGKGAEYKPFIEGWLQAEEPWGRPVDILFMPDGAMLVSDDHANAIYRVTYSGSR